MDEQPESEKWFAKTPDWARDKVGVDASCQFVKHLVPCHNNITIES